ncbi:glycosyltransferase family 4 protein [Paenibacillus campi]|uniref:glycosyltransferase family 4 protein n=1 Tax=Paenibacillus campi TaxID=3106031 RepID=UPI002AFF0536|nr:glycosyltransferase family 4 protein [Paenibacillus sp. SGZ-1009]
MNIVFLLGSADISGGTYVIFEHAIRMMNNGVKVTIVTEEEVNKERLQWHPESKALNWETYSSISDIRFDICIATWWRTVFELHRIKASKYVYFIQSIESRFYNDSEKPLRQLVDSTYTLPLYMITEANWIKEYLYEHFNQQAYLVPNGIRKDIYKVTGKMHAERKENKLRILVEGPVDVGFKNVPKTIELCKQSDADEIWLLTSSDINFYPGVDKIFSRVPIFETPEIYRSCDVVVKLSYVEGMFGPPLEMFHCGGTSITYDVTGHDEYIVNNENGVVVPKDKDDQVIRAINMFKDTEKLNAFKQQALSTAEKWPSWEQASQMFEKTLQQINSRQDSLSSQELKLKSEFLFNWYIIAENYKNMFLSKRDNRKIMILKDKLKTNYPKLFKFSKKMYYHYRIIKNNRK